MYCGILVSLVGWFFALDKPNYARWLSVHLRDMSMLGDVHPAVKAEFDEGKFVVNKTKTRTRTE